MGRLWLALRAFFRVLMEAELAGRVRELLEPAGELAAPEPSESDKPVSSRQPARAAARSDALTLLETLQREARLIDFLMEPLDNYSDAQIGAAVREVHRDCGQVLRRMFDFRPIVAGDEGSEVEVPADFDAQSYRLTGRVGGEPPLRGQLVHHGWVAQQCELPVWSGSIDAARVVAPAEVEIR